MRFIKEWSNWNPVLNQKVLDFIETNKTNLLHLWDKEKSEEDNMEFLINYFTENPDLMNNSHYLNNVTTILPKSGLRNSSPILQNIGGVKDFKSF